MPLSKKKQKRLESLGKKEKLTKAEQAEQSALLKEAEEKNDDSQNSQLDNQPDTTDNEAEESNEENEDNQDDGEDTSTDEGSGESDEESGEPEQQLATEPKQKGVEIPEDKPDKMIEVKQSSLDKILKKLEDQEEEIQTLRDAVGGSKIEQAEGKKKKKSEPRYFLKVMKDEDDKDHLVIGWQMSPDNRLIFHPNNPNVPVGEVVQAKFTMLDELVTDYIDYSKFTRINHLAYGTKVKEDDEGYLYLKMDDPKWGKELVKVHVSFVNP